MATQMFTPAPLAITGGVAPSIMNSPWARLMIRIMP